MKLLLDENLSPVVAQRLRSEDGVDAIHLEERGMLGASDAEVFEKAFVEDRLVVTLNVRDFERLARTRELHSGLVLIEMESLLREEQLACLRAVLKALVGQDMANRALRVSRGMPPVFEELP